MYLQEIPKSLTFIDRNTFSTYLNDSLIEWLNKEQILYCFFVDYVSNGFDSVAETYFMEFENAEDLINFKMVWL